MHDNLTYLINLYLNKLQKIILDLLKLERCL